MWRAIFLALGVTACLIGAQCMVLDHVVLKAKAKSAEADPPPAPPVSTPHAAPAQPTQTTFSADQPQGRVVEIKDWFPWTFLSFGAVVILYSFTIPKRMGQ